MRVTSLEVTAYCGCCDCCSWEHGLLLGPVYLAMESRLPFVHIRRRRGHPGSRRPFLLDRYWNPHTGKLAGKLYEGTTASGSLPRQALPGPLSLASLSHPRQLALRCLTPWRLLGRHGTIAADTSIFPMGTVMHVPGYGWGTVEDRGGAIRGHKIDLYYKRHDSALEWGRRNLQVRYAKPGQRSLDSLPTPVKELLILCVSAHRALLGS